MGKTSKKKNTKSFPGQKPAPLDITSKKNGWKIPFVHISLISLIGIIIYSNTFNHQFVFDDIYNIVDNYSIRDLSHLSLKESRWFGFLTFSLNYQIGGLNPFGYHVFNLILHILNAALVYFLVLFTFNTPFLKVNGSSFMVHSKNHGGTTASYEPSTIIALFSALLFVSHPVQTQAVTYIVQRLASLATMFYLLSLVMYIKFRIQSSEPKTQNSKLKTFLYLSSILSAVLAMKTKEIAFTLPVIITLYEFMFFDGKIKKRLLNLIPLLLTMLIIPLSLMGADKPIGDLISDVSEATRMQTDIPRWDYLFTQFRVMVTYIRLLFLPTNQNLDYDYPIYNSFLDLNVFLSFLLLLSIVSLGVYLFYASRITHNALRLIAFGIFWFFITLSVESSIIPIKDVVYEHRLYLPSVGASAAFTSTVFYFISRLKPHASRYSLTTACLLLSAVIIAFSIAAYQRNTVWRDEVSLWEDVVKKSPNKARGHNNLGVAYEKKGLLDEAVKEQQTALRLRPDYPEAHNSLGVTYGEKGLLDNAINEFQTALRLAPYYANALNNLGVAYEKKGLLDNAINEFQTALRLRPDYADVHNNLGVAYEKKGLLDEAIKEYQTALRIAPHYTDAYNNLLMSYGKRDYLMRLQKGVNLP